MRVIKIGGRAQGDRRLVKLVKEAFIRSGGKLCIVHGGGDEVSSLQAELGGSPRFAEGRRITSPSDLRLLRMVLSGLINKRLVNAFLHEGIPTVGLSGEDGALIRARPTSDASLGAVGIPEEVNAKLVQIIVSSHYMPVISPLGYDQSNGDPGVLNINGDDAAAAIAAAIKATELLFVSDVSGVSADDGTVLSSLESAESARLIKAGTVRGGMAAKLWAAQAALSGGVATVRISDLEGIMDDTRGTTINHSASETK